MSNRRKPAAPTSIREALLAVLNVEYARAIGRKDLERAEQITEIVESITRVFSEPAALPKVIEAAPVQRWEATGPVVEWTAPPPEPVFVPPPQTDLPPVGNYQLQDLLNSVPEGIWGDDERREEARGRVKDAVLRVTHDMIAQQMRYELALQAHNRNNRALELFEQEAIVSGVSVSDLAGRIINDRRTAERRMQHVYTIMARVSVQLDQLSGDDIEAATQAGIREIQALED